MHIRNMTNRGPVLASDIPPIEPFNDQQRKLIAKFGMLDFLPPLEKLFGLANEANE